MSNVRALCALLAFASCGSARQQSSSWVAAPSGIRPQLDVACIPPPSDYDTRTSACDENGFPAISPDQQIAVANILETSSGDTELYVQFVDPTTSRIVRSDLVVGNDQYFEPDSAQADAGVKPPARVEDVQRRLDTLRFRSMRALGTASDRDGNGEPYVVDLVGDTVRLLGSGSPKVVWQHQFDQVPAATHPHCGELRLARVRAWWDPATKFLLVKGSYEERTDGARGCGHFHSCGTNAFRVWRLPNLPRSS